MSKESKNRKDESEQMCPKEDLRLINLQELSAGAPGLTAAAGSYLAETAVICFNECQHSPGVVFPVTGDFSEIFSVSWNAAATLQMQRTYADLQEATEYGASGIAILIMRSLADLSVFRVGRIFTDYEPRKPNLS